MKLSTLSIGNSMKHTWLYYVASVQFLDLLYKIEWEVANCRPHLKQNLTLKIWSFALVCSWPLLRQLYLIIILFTLLCEIMTHVMVFWVVTSCSDVVGHQHFSLPCRLHLQHGSLKCWYPTASLQSVTTQNTMTWTFSVVKTWSLV
jgi:hypothetical protein